MPVRRDADGNIIDERVSLTGQSERPDPVGEDGSKAATGPRTADIAGATDVRGGLPTAPRAGLRDAGRYGAPTTPVRDRRADRDAERTRIYRPNQPDALAEGNAGSKDRSAQATDDPTVDPPVGWLVIVGGPGKGRVATLGMGVNSIGRDRTERVSLDYGDAMISRTNHGAVTYDPRGRKFYVQHGGGTNLTYVNDEPVLAPRELEPLTHVQMGNTVLRFVPLCGVDFSWDDEAGGD